MSEYIENLAIDIYKLYLNNLGAKKTSIVVEQTLGLKNLFIFEHKDVNIVKFNTSTLIYVNLTLVEKLHELVLDYIMLDYPETDDKNLEKHSQSTFIYTVFYIAFILDYKL